MSGVASISAEKLKKRGKNERKITPESMQVERERERESIRLWKKERMQVALKKGRGKRGACWLHREHIPT